MVQLPSAVILRFAPAGQNVVPEYVPISFTSSSVSDGPGSAAALGTRPSRERARLAAGRGAGQAVMMTRWGACWGVLATIPAMEYP